MSLRDLIARDAKAIFLTLDMPDVQAVKYRTKAQAIEEAIDTLALVEQSSPTKARADRGRTFESPLTIEIPVADVASPAVGDKVLLIPRPGESARWVEVAQRLRSDEGIHRLEMGR